MWLRPKTFGEKLLMCELLCRHFTYLIKRAAGQAKILHGLEHRTVLLWGILRLEQLLTHYGFKNSEIDSLVFKLLERLAEEQSPQENQEDSLNDLLAFYARLKREKLLDQLQEDKGSTSLQIESFSKAFATYFVKGRNEKMIAFNQAWRFYQVWRYADRKIQAFVKYDLRKEA